MLLSLRIENYALINQTSMAFPQGFTAITGETGAGKSIMLGALGLVLGQRADTGVLQDKNKRCIVEAEFTIDDNLRPIFDDNDLDFDFHSIFRREIAPNGKSRAFINDVPVQLPIMKILGDNLMDIHSQHTTLTLKGSSFQLSIIDNYLDDITLPNTYKAAYKQWKKLQNEITELENKHREFQKEQSYYQYLVEELANAKLRVGEQEELEQDVDLMSNSEEIKLQITQSLALLDNEEVVSVFSNLSQVKSNISKISSHDPNLNNISQRLDSAFIELKDIGQELSNFNDNVSFSQQTLDSANDRLDLIYRLQSKHAVNSISELLEIKQDLNNKLSYNEDLEIQIEQKKKENSVVWSQLSDVALRLSQMRKAAAKTIEKEVLPLLCDMALPASSLQIDVLSDTERYSESGIDYIDFLFSANKGSELKPLYKVASGGELARLMLALKAVLSRKSNMPTIIFDEIDSGVSGDIAAKVGNIIKQMAERHQLIVITHLPQMASKATNHYKVFKQEDSDTTTSQIKQLNQQERVEEIAKMLSNDRITQAAIDNAMELLG
ncbi:MAG: DNA repair protein RecN [Bacteroidales bacterium]|jgi:DNA repair protein RecN (Recombination protein N)|nr:DNA repair protein RecN [Bacteroidales bacterium]